MYMSSIGRGLMARFALGTCLVLVSAAPRRSSAQASPARLAGATSTLGSTIVSNPTDFQPELIYKKFPTTEPVVPGVPWQLGFGVLLDTAPPSIGVTLSLDPAGQNADIQIVDGSATFLIQGALNSNYDPIERFEILYTGALNPFTGPIDFLLTPDGLPAIPIRVNLNVTAQPGFPVSIVSFFSVTLSVGNIVGDQNLEVLVPGTVSGVSGLHAFDHTGTPLSGWPFRLNDPDIVEQAYSSPAVVDLDRDGKAEVLVVGVLRRSTPNSRAPAGFVSTRSLLAVEGSGAVRWRIDDDIRAFSIPAVADLSGDGMLDIIVGGGANLMRFDKDGVRLAGWQVETLNDTAINVPVIADVDGNPGNGLEIVACTPKLGTPGSAQVYVWNQDGSLHGPAWPKTLEACQAPAVVDLDGDPTNGRELVMAIDHAVPEVDPTTGFLNTFTVFAWHADGTDVSGWPHRVWRDPSTFPDDRVPSSPSVADLDGDGDMEVVVGTYGQGNKANGNLFVFHHDGTLDPNWPQWAGTAQTPTPWGGTALVDLDNDGQLEIVTASFPGVNVFRSDGTQFEGFPRLTTDNFGQAMVADLDDDGRLEIVSVSLTGFLSAWKVLAPSSNTEPWARFRQNPARTGTPDRVFVAAIPTLSVVGLAVTFCLLLGAGAHVIRRNTRRSTN